MRDTAPARNAIGGEAPSSCAPGAFPQKPKRGRPRTPIDETALREAVERGLDVPQLAHLFNCHANTVIRRLAELRKAGRPCIRQLVTRIPVHAPPTAPLKDTGSDETQAELLRLARVTLADQMRNGEPAHRIAAARAVIVTPPPDADKPRDRADRSDLLERLRDAAPLDPDSGTESGTESPDPLDTPLHVPLNVISAQVYTPSQPPKVTA